MPSTGTLHKTFGERPRRGTADYKACLRSLTVDRSYDFPALRLERSVPYDSLRQRFETSGIVPCLRDTACSSPDGDALASRARSSPVLSIHRAGRPNCAVLLIVGIKFQLWWLYDGCRTDDILLFMIERQSHLGGCWAYAQFCTQKKARGHEVLYGTRTCI
jgi:hypothetical protein